MNKFMPQISLKLILFLSLSAFIGCQDESVTTQKEPATFKTLRTANANDPLDSVRRFRLAHPSSRMIETVLLVSMKEQEVGLSGTKDHEFKDNEGALFWYPSTGTRRFWMPDTYFNLDLVFLDDELTIVDIDKNLEAHPGMDEPPNIVFSKTVRARHVLEVKASSEFAKALKVGERLQVLAPLNLSQIESKTRQLQ